MSEVTSKGGVEVRHDSGIIDEVVATGVDVHLEYLSDSTVWLKIGDVTITLWAKVRPLRIQASAEADTGGLTIHPDDLAAMAERTKRKYAKALEDLSHD